MFENYNFEGEIVKIEDSRLQYIEEIAKELNGVEKYIGVVVNTPTLHNTEVFLSAPVIKFNVKLFNLIDGLDNKNMSLEYGSHKVDVADIDVFKREIDYFFGQKLVKETIENLVKSIRDVVKKYEEEQKQEVADETEE